MKKDFRCKECGGAFFKECYEELVPLCPYCMGEGYLIFPEEKDQDDWHNGVES